MITGWLWKRPMRVRTRCASIQETFGSQEKVQAVVQACRAKNIAIRVGVNSGSLEKSKLAKYGGVTPEALCESALENVRLLEGYGFENIVVAVKSSSPYKMAAANRMIAQRCSYPLHLGVTEAGTLRLGETKGAAGIGGLLLSGIGDTLRVSLTADPVKEVLCGKKNSGRLGLRGRKAGAGVLSHLRKNKNRHYRNLRRV